MFKITLVIFILIIVILTGCTSQVNNAANVITISVLYNDIEKSPFQNDWRILKAYKEIQNVVLDVSLGDNIDYENAIDLYIKSDNPPDIILKCWPEAIESYANNGMLLPISDYEHLMPYFTAYIEKYDLRAEVDELRLSNGKYYILPGYQREIQVQQWIYRQDVFEDNKLTMPKTYDELFDALVILKGIYPDSTPITASWGGAHLFAMMGAGYGIPAGWAGTRYYNVEQNKWLFSPATENYRELYGFLNKCYEAGILDSAVFEQSNEDFIEKIENGKALVTVTWITSGFDTWNDQLKEKGIEDGKWMALPVLESTIGIKALPPVNKFRKGLVVSAGVAGKPYFEDLIKFLDWAVYSDEGMELTTWGIEGLTYETTSSGNIFLPNIKTIRNSKGTVDISKEYGFNLLFNLNENEEFEDYKKPDEILSFLLNSDEANETLSASPRLKLSSIEIELINLINEKLLPYVDEASRKFITGELSIDDDWTEYLMEIDNRGYTILEQTWNDVWEEQNGTR